jgi:hypothetical protein
MYDNLFSDDIKKQSDNYLDDVLNAADCKSELSLSFVSRVSFKDVP